ncbi:MAG: Ldh family oxidoreductase [Candidatus Atribacteria bacterium]|nr:MAG: Ldh family oxidoreductase [Candidatus Atribacteria bacterium]
MRFNVSEEDARVMADVLISADVRGVDSHGIIRLHSYYGDRLQQGLVNAASVVSVVHETPISASLDGGNGLGPVVAHKAMARCIAKARDSGIAAVTVRNSNHYGIAGYYAMMALPHDMIGVSLTNSQPLVAPTYGRTAMLGTNPIAVAVPAGTEHPYVLDMATSIVPIGRVTVYHESGETIPVGWGMDKDGNLTEFPDAVLDGGALLPLGGNDIMRGYKGYGLALLVDILSGVLPGAAFSTGVGHPNNPGQADVGHFFMALKVDLFRPAEEFKADMDELIQRIKGGAKTPGHDRIYIHGEKEFSHAERCATNGVPVIAPVVDALKAVGEQIGVPFDLTPIGEDSAEG